MLSSKLSVDEWQSLVRGRFPKAEFTQEDGSGCTYGEIGSWTATIGPDMQADVVGVYAEDFCSVAGILPDDDGDEYGVL